MTSYFPNIYLTLCGFRNIFSLGNSRPLCGPILGVPHHTAGAQHCIYKATPLGRVEMYDLLLIPKLRLHIDLLRSKVFEMGKMGTILSKFINLKNNRL